MPARVACLPIAQGTTGPARGYRRHDADADRSFASRAGRSRREACDICFRNYAPSLLQESPPCVDQSHAVAITLEKRNSELFLEGSDCSAQRRLPYIYGGRRTSEPARFCHRDEKSELTQIQVLARCSKPCDGPARPQERRTWSAGFKRTLKSLGRFRGSFSLVAGPPPPSHHLDADAAFRTC